MLVFTTAVVEKSVKVAIVTMAEGLKVIYPPPNQGGGMILQVCSH